MSTTINVNGDTQLTLKATLNGKNVFDEVYHNWVTGNEFVVDSDISSEAIVEAYKASGLFTK